MSDEDGAALVIRTVGRVAERMGLMTEAEFVRYSHGHELAAEPGPSVRDSQSTRPATGARARRERRADR